MKIYVDSGHKGPLLEQLAMDDIHGATTNPTLMKASGVTDYKGFAWTLIAESPDKPISFEVFAESFEEMERQARLIADWGDNVFVKIPVTDIHGVSSAQLVRRLSQDGVKLNVTAIFTEEQVRFVVEALSGGAPAIVSVFAGRIADTGRDPIPHLMQAKVICDAANVDNDNNAIELLWASQREVLNITHAEQAGCDIITATPEFLTKYRKSLDRDLADFSLATVQMFDKDAKAAGFKL